MLERTKAAVACLLLAGCGDGASEAFERALHALREGDLRKAESFANEAAARGGPELAASNEFLRGNVAFARCELAERQASTVAAEPFAWDVAINHGRKARDAWQRAAMSRSDWPAARRNVERALLKLAELERKKAEAEKKRQRKSDPQPRPRPQPKPKPPGTKDKDAEPDAPHLKELSPEEVARLIEKLVEKEKEKLALRRSERKKRTAAVERDW